MLTRFQLLEQHFRTDPGGETDVWRDIPVWPILRMAVMRRQSLSLATYNLKANNPWGTDMPSWAWRTILDANLLHRNAAVPAISPDSDLVLCTHSMEHEFGSTQLGAVHPVVERVRRFRATGGTASDRMVLCWQDNKPPGRSGRIGGEDGQVDIHLSFARAAGYFRARQMARDRQLRGIITELLSHVDPLLEMPLDRESISLEIAKVIFWKKHFENLFVRLNTKRVFIQCYYNVIGLGAVLAANKAGIESFDVQHGLGGSTHYAYSWSYAPASARTILPTGFLCWSDFDVENIHQSIPFGHSTHVAGANWGRWIELHPALRNHLEKEVERLSRVTSGQRIVVYMLARGEDASMQRKVVAAAHPEGTRVAFRIHPLDRTAKAATVDPLDAAISDAWLPVVYEVAEAVIGQHSAACLEAALWGTKAVVFGPKAEFLFRSYTKVPSLTVCADLSEAVG